MGYLFRLFSFFFFCGFFLFFLWGGRGFGVHVLICRDILDLNTVLEKTICPFPQIMEILFDLKKKIIISK